MLTGPSYTTNARESLHQLSEAVTLRVPPSTLLKFERPRVPWPLGAKWLLL